MKKTIKWSIAIIFLGLIGYVIWNLSSPYKKVPVMNAIPPNPVFIIETNDSYKTWKKLSQSPVWATLKKHDFFSRIASGMDMMDTVINSNEKIAKFIGSHDLVISMHVLHKGVYDFIYAFDARRISKVLSAKDIFNGLLKAKFNIQTAPHGEYTIYRIYDENSRHYLCISLIHNIVIASYTQSLIEASIDQIDNPKFAADDHFFQIYDKVHGDGLLRVYINYSQLDEYTNGLLSTPNADIQQLSKSLYYTGLALDVDGDNLIQCDGYTNYNDTIPSSLHAIAQSGNGKTGLADILPIQTATSISLGFDRFTEYFDNMMSNLKDMPQKYQEYQGTIKQAESYLKIDIKKNIMSWIGDEAAMVQIPQMGLGKDNEFAVFLKTRNIKDAKENLEYVEKQIRKRTPVKFSQVEYNGYYINYLSMKGFFRMILGKYFQKLDKPYFTFIDDYVVFSNHPQTLKVVIDGFAKQSLLSNLPEYKSFTKKFSRHSNVLMMVNTVNFIKSLQGSVNASMWEDFQKNKEYFDCFPYMGFQLEREGSLFKTRFYVKYKGKEVVPVETSHNDTISTSTSDTLVTPESEQKKEEVSEILKKVDEYIPDNVNLPIYRISYSSGKTMVEIELKDGFRHGDYKEFYENGNPKVKGQFKKDHKDGSWKIYSDDGKLLQKVKFTDGKKVSP